MKSPSAKSKAGKQGLNNQKQGLKVQEQMKTMKLTSAKSKSEKFGLVGLVWFGRFGLVGLVW